MHALELKIPPPLVAFATGFGMWGLARLGPSPTRSIPRVVRGGAAATLALSGGALALAGVRAFRRQRTTINPLRPDASSALVRGGVYAHTRNPMYLGMLLTELGWAAWLASPLALAGPPVFAIYITRFQIVPEERALAALFGPAFTDYTARVRRWL